jgi:ATP adenylyltransferase
VDVLWSPWRYEYITGSDTAKESGCVFCNIQNSSASDEEKFILKRAEHNFVVLNIFPYATGHALIVPYAHVDHLDKLSKSASDELMDLTKITQTALAETYGPDGYNLGMNLGRSAGAGVADHLHMHILPRWSGDVNFITAIGNTRNMPEDLKTTYDKLKARI